MQIIGTLVCPQKPMLAANVQIDLNDDDPLPWEASDEMGRTWSRSNGSFVISGCGADFGPFNEPDPYMVIVHKCPSILQSATDNKDSTRKIQFALLKVQKFPVELSPVTMLKYIQYISGKEELVILGEMKEDKEDMYICLSESCLDQIEGRKKRDGSAVIFENDKWPNGRIPYVISSVYTLYQRATIARAISAYAARTCIRFTPRESFDIDYIIISKTNGCFADFAHVGGGPQQVSLTDECLNYATVIHELMHVIGFIHEHQRDDRDYFVNILWQNIIPGASTDFEKLTSLRLSHYGESYDYFSIMHYESTEGSRNGENTIEAKIQAVTPLMGRTADFSSSDIKRINRAYNCYNFLLYSK
uniref:Metalloendopeptidase n=1 Tax=Setaria digitata TaxID=48799 RepID=A0A915Q593_9BILA